MPGKGLTAFETEKRERAEAAKNGFLNKFFLSNQGDYAVFRFLEDGDDISYFGFHTVQVTVNGKAAWRDILCPVGSEESGITDCPCGPYVPADQRGRRSSQALTWVWVYRMGKTTPWSAEEPGTLVKKGALTFYEKEVNRPYILPLKSGSFDLVLNKFKEYLTLIDRDYKFTRMSAKGVAKTPVIYALDEVPGSEKPFAIPEEFDLPTTGYWAVQQSERAINTGRKKYYDYLRPVSDITDEDSDDVVDVGDDVDSDF